MQANNRLKLRYTKDIVPALKKELGLQQDLAVPTLRKVVVNMGVTDPQDPRQRKPIIDNIVEQFKVMTGQKPKITTAKKAIANFKLRAGDPVGVMVTLRGQLLWEFVDKLISVVLPRVKDFRGVSRVAFDQNGNYNLGLEEQIVFPELDYDLVERVRGLQITFVTSSKNPQHARALLEKLGMPFQKSESTK